MNTVVTSKEEILRTCMDLVSQNGLSSLNMRTVAQRCNVALGSIYNYFPSKSELTIATIENVWRDIFHMEKPCMEKMSFPDYVKWIYERVTAGMREYPNFFTAHSISFASEDKGQARQMMSRYFQHMENGLLEALKSDALIRENAFDETFTQVEFVRVVLSGILAILVEHKTSCNALLEIIRRTIY